MSSNAEMVARLVRSGSLRSPACIAAFESVDRKCFWPIWLDHLYAEMPLRQMRLHISAPQIYAEALEALMPLGPDTSFLNIGCGTGFFNSVVAEVTGDASTNHGIDIWPDVVDFARSRCKKAGKCVELFLGNVYELDVANSMRYDRIYLGACGNSRSKYLYHLLEVGGILVGPFQCGRDQQLRRVHRVSETEFSVEILESVRFACLVEPVRQKSATQEPATTGRWHLNYGLPGVNVNFTLRPRIWTLNGTASYPASFRAAVSCLLLSRSGNVSLMLPPEMWTQHVLPFCPRWWFEKVSTRMSNALGAQSSRSFPQRNVEYFESFHNGRRHAIGSPGDPDDFDERQRRLLEVERLEENSEVSNVDSEEDNSEGVDVESVALDYETPLPQLTSSHSEAARGGSEAFDLWRQLAISGRWQQLLTWANAVSSWLWTKGLLVFARRST